MVGFSRLLIFSFLSGVGVGCEDAAQSQQADPIQVSKIHAVAPDLIFQPQKGNAQAIESLVHSISKAEPEIGAIVDKSSEEWVAGDKANLIAFGEKFLISVEKLVSTSWVLGTHLSAESEFEKIQSTKRASKFLSSYAIAVAEGGSPEYAVRAILANRMIVLRLCESSNSYISFLIACTIDVSAEQNLRMSSVSGAMNSADLKQLQSQTDNRFMLRKSFENSLRGEWTFYDAHTLAQLGFPPKGTQFSETYLISDEEILKWHQINAKLFDHSKTVDLVVSFYRAAIEEMKSRNVPLQRSTIGTQLFAEIPEDPEARAKWAEKTPNALGLLVARTSEELLDYVQVIQKSEASRGLSEVVIAAQRGLAESGTLPKDMAELRKFGLPAHVKDAYSGKDFLYDPVRGIAWSVGPDGKDDGGNDPAERWVDDAKDRVVKVK